MTRLAQQIAETPLAPYVGLMRGMSRRDIQIVVTFLNEMMEEVEMSKENMDSQKLVEMARKKFNVPESPETKWFREHPVTFTEEELLFYGYPDVTDEELYQMSLKEGC